jgi:hypothetical protein
MTGQFGSGVTNQTFSIDPASPADPAGTHYYLAEQVGTTQMELSSGGWPVWRGFFTPFGQEIVNGGEQTSVGPVTADGTNNRYKFTGKERDAEPSQRLTDVRLLGIR